MRLSEQQADFWDMISDLNLWVRPVLKTSNVYMKVYCLYRTPKEQEELLRQKATKTLKSKHIIGLAVDLQIMKDGQPIYKTPIYELIGQYWIGIGGTWGGEWKWRDEMHFEYNESRRKEYLNRITPEIDLIKGED